MTGLEFVKSLFYVMALMIALGGMVLALQESGIGGDGIMRRRLGAYMEELKSINWTALPWRTSAHAVRLIDRAQRKYFSEADKSQTFSAFYIGLLFFALPAAALINAFSGGSPFLVLYYLFLFGALVFMNLVGEVRLLRGVHSVLAFVIGISILLIIPVYVLRSLTEVVLRDIYAYGIFSSLPVVFLWYVTAYGGMRAGEILLPARSIGTRAARTGNPRNLFLFTLPVGFFLVCLSLFAGYLSISVRVPERPWALALAGIAMVSVSIVATRALIAAGLKATGGAPAAGRLPAAYLASTALAAILSIGVYFLAFPDLPHPVTLSGAVNVLLGFAPSGDDLSLSPEFWVMHLPFLAPAAFIAILCLAAVAKVLLAAIGVLGVKGESYPFFMVGAVCWTTSLGLAGLAIVID